MFLCLIKKKPLPEDAEEELSRITAEAAEKLLKSIQLKLNKAQAQRQQEDPLTQIQQRELAIKEQELEHKKQMDMAKLELEAQKAMMNDKNQTERLESENKRRVRGLVLPLQKILQTLKFNLKRLKMKLSQKVRSLL